MRSPVVVGAFSCPRCGRRVAGAVAGHGTSAFSLYCRWCRVRLTPAGPSSGAEPAIRYGGVTFGPPGL